MNKILLIAALFLAPIAHGNSWFEINPQVFITNTKIQATVVNNTYYPIKCRGKILGRTQLNQLGYQKVEINSIPPGSHVFAYLNTWGTAFFIEGSAEIECKIF